MNRVGGGWQGRGGSKSLYSGPVDRKDIEDALEQLTGDVLRIIVLPNDRKQSERSPDVAFFLAESQSKPESRPLGRTDPNQTNQTQALPAPAPAPALAPARRPYTRRTPRTNDEFQR